MKTQKLIVIAAIVCLLVGVSGAAIAGKGDKVEECRTGFLSNETVLGDVIVTDRDCLIEGSLITGNVIVQQGKKNATGVFVMVNNVVHGTVDIKGGATVLTRNAILSETSPGLRISDGIGDSIVEQNAIQGGGGMEIIDNDQIAVLNNLIGGGGSIVLNANDQVLINRNIVYDGDIQCIGNEEELATENIAINGNITCFGQ